MIQYIDCGPSLYHTVRVRLASSLLPQCISTALSNHALLLDLDRPLKHRDIAAM